VAVWWERERRRRNGSFVAYGPSAEAEAIERDALSRIDELREKDLRERKRRPGGSVVVFSSPFAGGHYDASDRTVSRRRVRRDEIRVTG